MSPQDKVSGSAEEKEKAAKKFAEISSGRCRDQCNYKCRIVHRGQRLWLCDCDAAYEALVDPEKRQIYDRHGEEGLKQHDAQGGGGGGPQDIFSQCVPFCHLGSSMQSALQSSMQSFMQSSMQNLQAHCLSVAAAHVH